MRSQLKSVPGHGTVTGQLEQHLATAHTRIEKAFLEGGEVLVSVMDIMGSLVDLLDRLTGTLDGRTTSGTIAGLNATVADLARLPGIEQSRQSTFLELEDVCRGTLGHVDDMRETIRYLRVFATSVKITGAGLADFTEFADEIRERIQSGAIEVDRFAGQLAQMRCQLESAGKFSGSVLADFSATIPAIVADLETSSLQIADQHREMSIIANQVKSVASGVQDKIGSVLSALQIGDITRQRIEHIQTTMQFHEEFLAGDGKGLKPAARRNISESVHRLIGAQVNETVEEFQRQCRNIFSTISSFASDAAEILRLHGLLDQKIGGADQNVLRSMETNISDACNLVVRVQDSSGKADEVVGSVMQTADELLKGIKVIRAIKSDIHYMALNSNLRCSRLGDEGRAVNVVSGELRIYAAKLEIPADATVIELQKVEASAEVLTSAESTAVSGIDKPLNQALNAIGKVSSDMETGLQAFASEGQQVFARISAAITKLNFEAELGDALVTCVELGNNLAVKQPVAVSALASEAGALSARIFKIYTMAQEREIHLAFFPIDETELPTEPAAAAASSDDDDEFDDLF